MTAAMLANGESDGCTTKYRVHVEACVRLDTLEPPMLRQLSETISSWLYNNFLVLTIGEHLHDLCKILIFGCFHRTNK